MTSRLLWRHTPDAGDGAHYALSDGLNISSARLLPDLQTVELRTSLQSAGQTYTLTVSGIHDRSPDANLIAANSQITFKAWEVSEFTFDPAARQIGASITQDNLAPDWQNEPMTVRDAGFGPGLGEIDNSADSGFLLRSRGQARDVEVETAFSNGTIAMRLTDEGRAILFDLNWTQPRLTISLAEGYGAQNFHPKQRFVLLDSTDLAALAKGFSTTRRPSDRFTFGVEGFDYYVKFNGVEFVRFKDFRHMNEGSVGAKVISSDGLSRTQVRFKAPQPLLSNYENLDLDLRDFGLRGIQARGSITAGSDQLRLQSVPTEPFQVGDWVIIETGREAGRGLRGSRGVGGAWPALSYPTLVAMQNDRSKPSGTFAWVEADGNVHQFHGTGWTQRLISGYATGTDYPFQYYYTAKAVPKALKAKILAISADGSTITLDRSASAATTDAAIHLDSSLPLLNLLRLSQRRHNAMDTLESVNSEWAGGVPEFVPGRGLTMRIPAGQFAIGEPLRIENVTGWKLLGAGTNATRFYTPAGSALVGIWVSGSTGVELSGFHWAGNARDHGFGLNWGTVTHAMSLTETQVPGASQTIAMDGCTASVAKDILITDIFPGVAFGGSTDCWAERVTVKLTNGNREYWGWMFIAHGHSIGGGFRDCSVTSPTVMAGFESFSSFGTHFINCSGVNATVAINCGGGFLFKDCVFRFTPNSLPDDSNFKFVGQGIININSNTQDPTYLNFGGRVENVTMIQDGYLSSELDLAHGIIVNDLNQNVVVIGGRFVAPPYAGNPRFTHAVALNSTARNLYIDGFTANSKALPLSLNGDITVQDGIVRNSFADRIVTGTQALLENSFPASNLKPEIALLRSGAAMILTNSITIGTPGNPAIMGTMSTNLDRSINIQADGRMGDAADRLHFAYLEMRGDFEMVIEPPVFIEVPPLTDNPEAGLMLREDLHHLGRMAALESLFSVFRNAGQAGHGSVESMWIRDLAGNPRRRFPPEFRGHPSGSQTRMALRREGDLVTVWSSQGTGVVPSLSQQTEIPGLGANGVLYAGVYASSWIVGEQVDVRFQQFTLLDLSPVASQRVKQGQELRLAFPLYDPNANQHHTWSLGPGAPVGAVIDASSGLFTWTPSADQVPRDWSITVTVIDGGTPPLSDSYTFKVAAQTLNSPPAILPVPTQEVRQTAQLTVQLRATDEEHNTIKWTLVQSPTGATIDPNAGIFAWRPGAEHPPGGYSVTVRATDNGQPPQSDDATFSIQVFPAEVRAKIVLDPSPFIRDTIIPKNSLGPDWLNSPSKIVQQNHWTTDPSNYLVANSQDPYILQTKENSRDQEVDTWMRVGRTFLRQTEGGKAVYFELQLEVPKGQLTVGILTGQTETDYYPSAHFPLYRVEDLSALLPDLRHTPTDGDYFTFGVDGMDIYAKFNGKEFLRFKEYRHMQPGAVAFKAPQGYGLRSTTVRFKTDRPLFSDLANNILDMRDLGLQEMLTTGSIDALSNILRLNESSDPPFKVGDWIIAETGAEAGKGRRGTIGVGGVWPNLHYPNAAARDADTSQPVDMNAWIESDGTVWHWDGTEWRDVAHSMNEAGGITEDYYVAKAVPKALRAVVTQVSADGLTLTLDEAAQASASNANVYLDAAAKHLLNRTSDVPGWAAPITPTNLVLLLPPGNFAIGDQIMLSAIDFGGGSKSLIGAGTNATRIFSPRGTHSASIRFNYAPGSVASGFHLAGNVHDEGFGLGFRNPRLFSGNGIREIGGTYNFGNNHGIYFNNSSDCIARDLLISDVFVALEVSASTNARLERIQVTMAAPRRSPQPVVLFNGGSVGGEVSDLSIDSAMLTMGIHISNSPDKGFTRISSRNAFLWWIGEMGNAQLKDSTFVVDAMAQEGMDGWAPAYFPMVWLQAAPRLGDSILVEDVQMLQRGYANSRNEILRGLLFHGALGDVQVKGGSYRAPDYLVGSNTDGPVGLFAEEANVWAEGYRISGKPRNYNVYVARGTVTNVWADVIRVDPPATMINCWADSNLAPVIGFFDPRFGLQLTNSQVIGTVGNPVEVGSTLLLQDGRVEVVAGGAGIGARDQVRFAYQQIVGDFDAMVRVVAIDQRNSESRGGLMVRQSLNSNSRQISFYGQRQSHANGYFRQRDGQPIGYFPLSDDNTWPQPNSWLRLRRIGNQFTAFTGSAHGWIWQQKGQVTLPQFSDPAPDSVYLGLFATSEDNAPGHTARATFSDMRVISLLSSNQLRPHPEGRQIQIPFTAADFNHPAQALTWSLGSPRPAGAEIDPKTGLFTWTPTETQGPGSFAFTVRVTDDGTPPLSDTNTFTVVVEELNAAPSLTLPADQIIDERVPFSAKAIATDGDLPAQSLTFERVSGPAGLTVNSGSGVIEWTPTEEQGPGTHVVTIRVLDNGAPGQSATNRFTLTVRETNIAPKLPALSDRTIPELAPLILVNTATDEDLPPNTLSYTLTGPANALIDAKGVITWTPTEAQGPGSYTFITVVRDNGVPSLSVTSSFTVVVGEVNSPPVLAVISEATTEELREVTFAATAADSDLPENPLSFSLDAGAPVGAGITAAGVFRWTPTEAQGPGTYSISVRVTDGGAPPLSDAKVVTVYVNELNLVPVLPIQTNRTMAELTMLVVTNTANDMDLPTNALTYVLTGPANAAIDANGVITWTPTEAQGPGTHAFTTVVTDNGTPKLSATNSFMVSVLETNGPPVLAAIPDGRVEKQQELSFLATATDSDFPANKLMFSLDPGAPADATISDAGAFRWTPTEAQGSRTYSISLRVTDDGVPPLTDAKTFTVTVGKGNTPPTVAIVAPVSGAKFLAPATIAIEASASDGDGALGKVEFFSANRLLGEKLLAPFVFTWSKVPAGRYALTARAIDQQGAATTSEPVTIWVAEAWHGAVVTEGEFRLTLAGEPGREYVIESSEDLTDWTLVQTKRADANGNVPFAESIGPRQVQRFYRARQLP